MKNNAVKNAVGSIWEGINHATQFGHKCLIFSSCVVTIFELQCPQAFNAWRSKSVRISGALCRTEPTSHIKRSHLLLSPKQGTIASIIMAGWSQGTRYHYQLSKLERKWNWEEKIWRQFSGKHLITCVIFFTHLPSYWVCDQLRVYFIIARSQNKKISWI